VPLAPGLSTSAETQESNTVADAAFSHSGVPRFEADVGTNLAQIARSTRGARALQGGSMRAHDIMTPNPCCCTTTDTVQEIARLMRDVDCGSIPVVDPRSGGVVGTVTDRDLAVRVLADGLGPETRVSNVMTTDVCCCAADDNIGIVEDVMADGQIRRVPIVDESGRLVGIIAQADLARAAQGKRRRVSEHEVAILVEKISEPSRGAARPPVPGMEQRL
jgi:CBS domain-containing protein